MKIAILYGTETGNAEMVADDLKSALEGEHEVSVRNLADVDPAGDLSADAFHFVICSTYGEGELPQSARPFDERLRQGAPDLSAIRFAMFGLGDEEYAETFNHGSARLAERLTAHGARQFGTRLTHNASGAALAEELALPWAEDVLREVEKAGAN